eukprot:70181_1
MAFLASLLSVTASTLSYMIEKDASDTIVVQYYLLTECKIRSNSINIEDESKQESEDKGVNITKGRSDTIYSVVEDEEETCASTIITAEERENLIQNRGKTQALAEHISETFGISTKNIEVGYSRLTKLGLITHVVHFLYEDDLKRMEDELQNENVTPSFYVEQLYLSAKTEITDAFRTHFKLNQDFIVAFQQTFSTKLKLTITQTYDKVQDNMNNDTTNRRSELLKRTVTRIELSRMDRKKDDVDDDSVVEEDHTIEFELEINKLFKKLGVTDIDTQKDMLIDFAQNKDEGILINTSKNAETSNLL